MTISFTATNPCHMWPTARAVGELGALGHFYSGYPAWKMPATDPATLRTHSLRTNIVYSLLKYAPAWLRPSSRALFLWQDHGLDRWVARHLEPCDFIHAMPGQALHTFRAARRAGIRTVLNHATGPIREWVRIMEPEYSRIGQKLTTVCPYDAAYFEREDEEYLLADYHCAASSVVRDQLLHMGIPARQIVVIPYGADTNTRVFRRGENDTPPREFRILFAGQIGLRKGLRTLLDALTLCGKPEWRIDFVGTKHPESAQDLAAYKGTVPLEFHGTKSQAQLAAMMRASSVLVLPSLEEGFGLVVPQALNCGLPCIVSDRVGGKDLIRPGENGAIFPIGDAEALARELIHASQNPRRTKDNYRWEEPARKLVEWSREIAGKRP